MFGGIRREGRLWDFLLFVIVKVVLDVVVVVRVKRRGRRVVELISQLMGRDGVDGERRRTTHWKMVDESKFQSKWLPFAPSHISFVSTAIWEDNECMMSSNNKRHNNSDFLFRTVSYSPELSRLLMSRFLDSALCCSLPVNRE